MTEAGTTKGQISGAGCLSLGGDAGSVSGLGGPLGAAIASLCVAGSPEQGWTRMPQAVGDLWRWSGAERGLLPRSALRT